MKSFLHADGEGLSLESMNIREWKDLQGIFDHYHQTHWKDLVAIYQEKLQSMKNANRKRDDDGDDGDARGERRASDARVSYGEDYLSERDLDWMLRLIRMRGGKEFVDVVLEERVKKRV